MPILQVRDFPEHMYRALEARAKKERRSLSQQAIVLLSKELGALPSNRTRRQEVLAKLEDFHQSNPQALVNLQDPVDLIRADRER